MSIHISIEDGSFREQARYSVGRSPQSLTVADLNNDGQQDLIVTNLGTNHISVLLSIGIDSFQSEIRYSTDTNPFAIGVADLKNDSLLDIVVTSCHSNQFVVVTDINHDTRLDILITNRDSNSISLFLGYGNRTFATVIQFQLEYDSKPFTLDIGDLNGDNKLLLQTC